MGRKIYILNQNEIERSMKSVLLFFFFKYAMIHNILRVCTVTKHNYFHSKNERCCFLTVNVLNIASNLIISYVSDSPSLNI